MCFLSLPALAPGFVKRSQGSTEGQNPSSAQHLQSPLTSGTRAGAGSISWLRGGKNVEIQSRHWEWSLELSKCLSVGYNLGLSSSALPKAKVLYEN